ncbi:DUF4386 domain-containing protein [Candidatus Bipolaricaulota bacterium]
MNSSRKIAIAVGVLFIIATLAGVSQFAFRGSLSAPDYLTQIAAHDGQITFAACLDLIVVGAIFAIPVVLFPILKKHHVHAARGYLVARIFEAVPLVVGTISLLALVILSREFVAAGAPDAAHYTTLGALLLATIDTTLLIGGQIIFSLTALVLNVSLYQSRLVPRFISVWGLLGVPLMFAGGVSILFGLIASSSTIATALVVPLAVQEMVFAVWLIVKGFNPAATASGSAK